MSRLCNLYKEISRISNAMIKNRRQIRIRPQGHAIRYFKLSDLRSDSKKKLMNPTRREIIEEIRSMNISSRLRKYGTRKGSQISRFARNLSRIKKPRDFCNAVVHRWKITTDCDD